jgi:hypothetical protein
MRKMLCRNPKMLQKMMLHSILMVCFACIVFCTDAFQNAIVNPSYARSLPSNIRYAAGAPGLHHLVMQMVSPPIKDVNGDTKNSINGDAINTDGTMDLLSKESTSSLAQAPSLQSIAPPNKRTLPSNWLGEKAYILSTAALIGLTTGTNIAVFKKAVEFVREILYGDGIELPPRIYELFNGAEAAFSDEHVLRLSEIIPVALAPAVGGLLVGVLLKVGGDLPPGLRDTVTEGKSTAWVSYVLFPYTIRIILLIIFC